jgi:hypothetical protein
MKKKHLIIIAITVFSFFAGLTNVQAQDNNNSKSFEIFGYNQDTTLSFGSYLTKTSWLITYGPDFIDNNNDHSLKMNNKLGAPYFMTPAKASIEKDIYGFRHWKHTKGFSLVGVFSSTSLRPHNFAALDAYIKYDLNTLIGDTKFFDPYVLMGVGYTYIDYPYGSYVVDHHVVSSSTGNYYAGPSLKDQSPNFNLGVGFNIWVFKNVGINFQSVAKFGLFAKSFQGTNYMQHSIGLVFKIGGGKEEVVVVVPVSTYKRSKEAEDALIHLREHINK